MANWFKRSKDGLEGAEKREMPEGVWVKCNNCSQAIYSRKLERNFQVCPECDHHMRLSASGYIALLADDGSWSSLFANLKSIDPLGFKDSKKYVDRLTASMKKTGNNDAIQTGECSIFGHPVVLSVMDFRFLGGSVGSVLGESLARAIDFAVETNRGLIVISCSGGMRMQEGMFSLMQMAKTSSRLTKLSRAKLPFISILTDPTTGGTTASFSMLGDLNIAEPNALIGFAGPRVIKQTIGQDLPEGFQRSEFLLEHGFLDQIVHRHKLKEHLADYLMLFTGKQNEIVSDDVKNS
ncbi:acetyl-CoA carboxylase, carboxyltransferase subunit beta [bacterium]|nr:acetyl-CoA carboxylase, carboxyltransferase subunit beta [bacterium]